MPDMSNVLALIPARRGSKGVPHKNWRALAGQSCVERAVRCARDAGIPTIAVTSDTDWLIDQCIAVRRPFELAQDDTPMVDVVQHALEQVPGPPDQIVVLLQPSSPLRTPDHITTAVEMMQAGAGSVVSVVPVESAHRLCMVSSSDQTLWPALSRYRFIEDMPSRRQSAQPSFSRDGTVYAFRREHGAVGLLYQYPCRPLIIPPEASLTIDTLADWKEAEYRLARAESAS